MTIVLGHSKVRSPHPFQKKNIVSLFSLVSVSIFLGSMLVLDVINYANAESGIGKDIFKVVVSIFGVTRDTGDFVATVTVEGNSRVKSFDIDSIYLKSGNNNSSDNGNIVEYIATFPDVVVNSGDGYKSCVLMLQTMDQYCKEGQNSPAKRPEFVDISLDKGAKMSESGKEIEDENDS